MTQKLPLSIEAMRATAQRLAPYIARTPVHVWHSDLLREQLGSDSKVFAKLELLQHTGVFKLRGALSVLLNTPADALSQGITAMSAGNHAIATAYAARELGLDAQLIMQSSANPFRIARAQSFGAQIEMAADGPSGFARVEQLRREQGRFFVHPFEGELTTLGTATVGLEWIEQSPSLDAVIVPVGGGGLISGVSAAFRALSPDTKIYGVEPEGANVMQRSLAAGEPLHLDSVNTIADSLGPPMTLPYAFACVQSAVDEVVSVSDNAMRDAIELIFTELKFAVEPAAAAATAALLGPLREKLQDKQVGIILCGSNIDRASFNALLDRRD